MSTLNPTHIDVIAKHSLEFSEFYVEWRCRCEDPEARWSGAGISVRPLHAAHVVSQLADAGYSIVPNGAAPKRHRGIEPDTEMGGVACSECGWHLSGRTVDNDTQERHHREHSAAAEGEKP